VEDWWRRRYPDEFQFTWERNTSQGRVQSRLDRFYSSFSLRPWISSIDASPNPFSDHKSVCLLLNPPNPPKRGKGSWSFNSSLLKNKEFEKRIIDLLNQYSFPSIDDDALREWDLLKYNIKMESIEFSTKLAKDKKVEMHDLNRRLSILEKEDFNLNPELLKEYDLVKERLLQLEKYELNGLKVRSKIKTLELGNSASPFITAMSEKAKESSSLIQSLKDRDGVTHSSPDKMLEIASDYYSSLFKAPDITHEVLDS
jgi:hypothetical protein